MLCRALWRSGLNSSQQAIEPQQVWAFEVPAVCAAAWLELAYIPSQHFALFNDSSFASSAREIIAVGAADGSVHLIGPNRWRRRICRLAMHSLYVTMCPCNECRVSPLTLDPRRALLFRVA